VFKQIRFWLASLFSLPSFNQNFVTMLYDRYLGHHKIIHFRGGQPVYSLTLPPYFSKPYTYLTLNLLFRLMQNRALPNLASIAVTDSCNANCQHCSFFSSLDDKNKKVLSFSEMSNLIKQIQDLGVSMINFVGGEPLLHPGILKIISLVDKDKSNVTLFTNGWHLAALAKDLKKVGVGGIYVSLDASEAKTHDLKRGTPGLFSRALVGLTAARKIGLSVGISCCLDEAAFRAGELDKIIQLSKRERVHEVLVFDALPVGKSCQRADLYGQPAWVEAMIAHVKKYNLDPSYPGVLIYGYTQRHSSIGCAGGVSYLYLTPYGEVCPCDFYHQKFGTIREEKLATLWEKMNQQFAPHGSTWDACHVHQQQLKPLEKRNKKCYTEARS
jgi:MoaA/NifB/PqqE/SkfB family radical SAM enzyme